MTLDEIADLTKMEEVTGFVRMPLPKKDSKIDLPTDIKALFWNVRSLSYLAVLENGDVKAFVKPDSTWIILTSIEDTMFKILLRNKTLRPVVFS